MRKLLIICLIILLITLPVASAHQHEIRVDEKKIVGTGLGVVFVIGQHSVLCADGTAFDEYIVSFTDYDKINIGDTVTLETGPNDDFKVISIKTA